MRRKIKLLFIWTDLSKGGAERAFLNLATELNNLYDIKILLCYDRIDFQEIPISLPIQSIINREDKPAPKFLRHLKIFLFLLSNIFKSDLIISYDTPIVLIMTGLIGRVLFWKKIIYWIHVCKSELKQTTKNWQDKIIKWNLAKALKCVCVSKTSQSSLIKYMGTDKKNSLVINNLLECNSLDRLKKKDGRLIISALGRITKEKRFDLLVGAAERLVKQGLNIKFIIGGDGKEKESLSLLIKELKLEDCICLPGTVENPITFISNSDIFVSCSETEALPYNVIEALACGKPVIVTDTGAAEIVEYGKYGVVVERNNIDELSKAIYDLVINPSKREDLSAKAHLALQKYDNEKILEQWRNLIVS